MVDWLSPMQQTYEYYIVDPRTWKDVKRLDNVVSSSINRDLTVETRGSASIVVNDSVGEDYVGIYLVTVQNGVRERHPLGVFLVQTPSSNYNGKYREITMDAYTPLIELKEDKPPVGYFIPKQENILERAYVLTKEHLRAPVVKTTNALPLFSNFIANEDDTWMSFLSDLVKNAKYTYGLDERCRILFVPDQDTNALQPVWTYNDDNSSILYDDITFDHDLFGIPNVVEVIYSSNGFTYTYTAQNTDPNSPTSIPRRGRVILHREKNPSFGAEPTRSMIEDYAEKTLRELSTVEYTVRYRHGYCPVRIGDCVRLNYKRAELNGIKAKVISQDISCTDGCPVDETAVFTRKLYG